MSYKVFGVVTGETFPIMRCRKVQKWTICLVTAPPRTIPQVFSIFKVTSFPSRQFISHLVSLSATSSAGSGRTDRLGIPSSKEGMIQISERIGRRTTLFTVRIHSGSGCPFGELAWRITINQKVGPGGQLCVYIYIYILIHLYFIISIYIYIYYHIFIFICYTCILPRASVTLGVPGDVGGGLDFGCWAKICAGELACGLKGVPPWPPAFKYQNYNFKVLPR